MSVHLPRIFSRRTGRLNASLARAARLMLRPQGAPPSSGGATNPPADVRSLLELSIHHTKPLFFFPPEAAFHVPERLPTISRRRSWTVSASGSCWYVFCTFWRIFTSRCSPKGGKEGRDPKLASRSVAVFLSFWGRGFLKGILLPLRL